MARNDAPPSPKQGVTAEHQHGEDGDCDEAFAHRASLHQSAPAVKRHPRQAESSLCARRGWSTRASLRL